MALKPSSMPLSASQDRSVKYHYSWATKREGFVGFGMITYLGFTELLVKRPLSLSSFI